MSGGIRAAGGFLVLADIPGFTRFVTASELEHGAWVTGQLLEAVMRGLAPPLEIQELEGDAVFALGPDRLLPDASVLPPALAAAVGAFKERQRGMAGDNDCTCRACCGVAAPDPKPLRPPGGGAPRGAPRPRRRLARPASPRQELEDRVADGERPERFRRRPGGHGEIALDSEPEAVEIRLEDLRLLLV